MGISTAKVHFITKMEVSGKGVLKMMKNMVKECSLIHTDKTSIKNMIEAN
jgi:hypothetical protein